MVLNPDLGFVYSRDKEDLALLEKFDELDKLYGSEARVDGEGTIFIPKWPEVERGTVSATRFMSLSSSRLSDEVAMRSGWKSKDKVKQLKINEVRKDGGSVEAGIRLCDHVLEELRGREKEQVEVVLGRTSEFLNLFQERGVGDFTEKERLAFKEETIESLIATGLDPETVELEVKRLMAMWTIKGSTGEDSRRILNQLITIQSLEAAERRAAVRRLELESYMARKYLEMRGALSLARTMSREAVAVVEEELRQRFLVNVYLEQPDAPIRKSMGYTRALAGHLAWLLTQTRVKPYRPIAWEVSSRLGVVNDYLTKEDRHLIFEMNLPSQLREDQQRLVELLKTQAEIYPEGVDL